MVCNEGDTMLQLKCECCRKKGIQLFEKMLIRRERNLVCTECGTEFNISGLAWLGLAWPGLARVGGTIFFCCWNAVVVLLFTYGLSILYNSDLQLRLFARAYFDDFHALKACWRIE